MGLGSHSAARPMAPLCRVCALLLPRGGESRASLEPVAVLALCLEASGPGGRQFRHVDATQVEGLLRSLGCLYAENLFTAHHISQRY